MIPLQLVVIEFASSNLIVRECLCDSFLGSMPRVLSKSNFSDLASDVQDASCRQQPIQPCQADPLTLIEQPGAASAASAPFSADLDQANGARNSQTARVLPLRWETNQMIVKQFA